MKKVRRTVFSYLGVKLDARGKDLPAEARRVRWRPTVALCHHLRPDVLVLLHEPRFATLAELVAEDAMAACEGALRVERVPVVLRDAWDFAQVYDALHATVTARTYETGTTDYVVHLSTGNNRVQIALFFLVLGRFLPGRTVHTIAPDDPTLPEGTESSHPWGSFREDLDDPTRNPAIRAFRSLSELTGAEVRLLRERQATTPGRAFGAQQEEVLEVAALTSDPILLMGPTGSGKTMLAKQIRERRGLKVFVSVNCATLTGDIALSALFGHERGAFTGANGPHDGYLQQAEGGLLFLDEIGELPLVAQAQLLKAIEEKRFRRIGGIREMKCDFQLVAATNKDLHEEVASGRFRRDLLARIDLWSFSLPGLREMRQAIPGLLEKALGRVQLPTRGSERGGLPRMARLADEARTRFAAFAKREDTPWEGNYRDVEAAARRMALRAGDSAIITPELVDWEERELRQRWAKQSPRVGDDLVTKYLGPVRAAEFDRFSRVQLDDVLRVCETARTLADASRQLFGPTRPGSAGTGKQGRKPQGERPQNESDRLSKYLARHQLRWPLIPYVSTPASDVSS